MGFVVAFIGVMRVAGGDDGLVVEEPPPQMREDLANRLEAQADVAGREFAFLEALGEVIV